MYNRPEREFLAYKTGHCDARYAAAEIALQADAKIESMREALRAMSDAMLLLKINSSLSVHQLAIIDEPLEQAKTVLALEGGI